MPTLQRFTVVPRLPSSIERMRQLAHNLMWVWTPEIRDLFVRVDPVIFDEVHGNPIELLTRVEQERLESLATDDAFLSHLDRAHAAYQAYMTRPTWFERRFSQAKNSKIAYFSMEYGLHESLPIYSGGLGVLAGDHLKTASDLGLPLVGIGLAYAEGYFRQFLNEDGWQGERYPINDWHRLPVEPVKDAGGKRVEIRVAYPEGDVVAILWRVQVGRVPLFLLDANLERNRPEDRSITGPLYGGDREFRIRQEIMLGIGGIHALEATGNRPDICHMNEGHSAFLALERIRRKMQEHGATFEVALEACAAGNVFTTHTPVPAGNDVFDPKLVTRYLEPHRAALGLTEEALLRLGRGQGEGASKDFSMPVLAIHTSGRFNGVSELHGEVSQEMYQELWPDLPAHEVPIESITNGVHVPSWISPQHAALYTRYIGPGWADEAQADKQWERILQIPDAELWQIHEQRKLRLIALAREWIAKARAARGQSAQDIARAREALDPRALTIGFARRFATYKRATLLFSDLDRVKRLVGSADRPVQLIFAGKAHPQDSGGKELIRQIVHASREAGLEGRVVFIEDYDMRIARALVSGVDIWLNTPRRPHEASGTSGMKAAANGALNVSILDGWWAEAWHDHARDVGWAIGRGEEYEDGEGDEIEADALYDLLEREVVPLYFQRDPHDGLPRQWIARMKNAISFLAPEFNTLRMVREYTERFYAPSIERARQLSEDKLGRAASLVDWKRRVREAWPRVGIRSVQSRSPSEVQVGEPIRVEAVVDLGPLSPDDVAVELYFGQTAGGHAIDQGETVRMKHAGTAQGGAHTYQGEIATHKSGAHAFSARIVPHHALVGDAIDTRLIRWA